MKLFISKPEDRDAVLVILGRNGYTVRQGKETQPGKKTAAQFVEVINGPSMNRSDTT